MKIGLISDTHSYLDPAVFKFFAECDEIWHAGDFGNVKISDQLADFKKLRGVYGNIDVAEIRKIYDEVNTFECDGVKVLMVHIAGAVSKYNPLVNEYIQQHKPDILICGHSHILKVVKDNVNNLLYVNPGAAGKTGFHQVRTILRFEIKEGKLQNMEAIELGKK